MEVSPGTDEGADEDWLEAGDVPEEHESPVMRLIEGRMLMMVRQGNRLFVTDAQCPHKFTDLTAGAVGDACITCPQHDATFDLRTGDCGPDRSWAGKLPVHRWRVDDGKLLVQLTG